MRALTDCLGGASLDAARTTHFGHVPPGQRALARELLDGTVRWHFRLDWQLGTLLNKPLAGRDRAVHSLLLLGLYQLQFMETPAARVVNESVAACRALRRPGLAGLVNAVLRRASRELGDLPADAPDTAHHAAPRWLIERLRRDWPDHAGPVLDACNGRGPMALRINRQRIQPEAYRALLDAAGIDHAPVPGSPAGCVLAAPVPTTQLPGFAEGQVSVQDGHAQLAATLLCPQPGQRVLDACAAPGGKSAHLLEAYPGISLSCLDVSEPRLQTLRAQLSRLGLVAEIIEGDAEHPGDWWDGRGFDHILLDAPCSATGVIRRHPDIRVLRREDDVAKLAGKQRRLLAALWPLLAPGGRLLYVTCSVLREENESIVSDFVQFEPGASPVPLDIPGALPCNPGYQLFPRDGGGDGFFYCLLEKR